VFGDGTQPWQYYKTAAQTNMLPLSGVFSEYDGSGYVVDYPTTMNQTSTQILINSFMQSGFIDESTRMTFVSSLYFEPNRKLFIDSYSVFELSPLRIMYFTFYVSVFKINYLDDPIVYHGYQLDIAVLVFILLTTCADLLLHLIIKVNGKRNWNYLWSLGSLINLVIMFMFIAYFSIFYNEPDQPLSEIIQSNGYLNLAQYSNGYSTGFTIKSIAFIIFSFKFLGGLKFSIQMIFFFRILQKSYKDLLGFLVIFLAMLIGITFFATEFYGPYNVQFNNFLNGLFTVFSILHLGDSTDRNALYQTNPTVTGVFLIAYSIIVMLIYTGYLLSAITENVRYISVYEAAIFEQTTLVDTALKLLDRVHTKAMLLKTKLQTKLIAMLPRFGKKNQDQAKDKEEQDTLVEPSS